MTDLKYEAPETLQAAVALLAGATGPARVLAGGTDVIVQMETDLIEPALLVDIKKIPETRQIAAENGGFRVGAAVPGMEIMSHAAFCKAWPGVVDGVKLIGSIQVQGPRLDRRQSLQRLAGRRQRAGPDRGRRDRADRRPERHARGAGRGDSGRPGQDLARQGRDHRLVLPAGAAAAFGRRLSALHAAHRDGHRGGRRRHQSHARCRRHLHGGARRARRGGADRAAGEGVRRRADRHASSTTPRSTSSPQAASAACRPIDDKRGTKEYRIKVAGVLAKRTALQALERARTELMSKKYHVTTTVNGDEYEFLCEAQQTLLDVLRDELMLTGTKEGCATGDCGACTVMVDGTMVCSCLVLAVETEGAKIDTIEGMAKGDDAASAAAQFPRAQRPAMRHLYARHSDRRARRCSSAIPIRPKPKSATGSPAISAGAPAMTRSSAPCRRRPRK